MKKTISIYVVSILLFIIATSTVKSDPNANTGKTGATGSYCTSCHSDYSLNAGGGSVTVSGLPSGVYVAGQAYPFSVTVNYPTNDRIKWGFAIKAVNPTGGAAVGTFTTTNTTYTRISSSEATSKTAPSTPSGANSYTFTGLTWTAPATASATAAVKFYYVGNAGDGDGSEAGDYIYSGTLNVVLPITLLNFSGNISNNKTILNWQTDKNTAVNYFDIERACNNNNFEKIGTVIGSNNSVITQYSFTDIQPLAGNNKYRLKMIEKDGSINYSKTLSITSKVIADYVTKIYPNPVKASEVINVEMVSQKNQPTTFFVYSQQGTFISKTERNLAVGTNAVSVKINRFVPAGNYYLVIQIGNKIIEKSSFIVVE